MVAQGLSSRRSAVGKAGAASPTPGRVRKRTTVYERSMPHFHVWIVEEIWRGRAGVVALVRLETNFEYRTAAVRSAPPGSLFRVFLCREEH